MIKSRIDNVLQVFIETPKALLWGFRLEWTVELARSGYGKQKTKVAVGQRKKIKLINAKREPLTPDLHWVVWLRLEVQSEKRRGLKTF